MRKWTMKVSVPASVSLLLIGLGPLSARPVPPPVVPVPLPAPVSAEGPPSCLNIQALPTPPSPPAVGVYRAKVSVTTATAGCGFQPGGIPVPEFTYYYKGPRNPASYYVPSPWNIAQVYTETGYMPPTEACPPSGPGIGKANARVLPGGPPDTISYSERWTLIDQNSFVVTGKYSSAACTADETIVFIRTGAE